MANTGYRYPSIRAWGKYLGSYAYYIEEQVRKAQDDDAPLNAIYFGGTGPEPRWITADEITNPHAAAFIEHWIDRV